MAETDELEEGLEELEVAEYLIMLYAFSTYTTYVSLANDDATPNDPHTRKGLNILRTVESQQGDGIKTFLLDKVKLDISQKTIIRTFRVRATTAQQAGLRAQTLRRVLTRNDSATVRAIFKESRARKGVITALTASILDEPSYALGQFASLPLQNAKIRSWIKAAHTLSGSDQVVQNSVDQAATTATDEVSKLKTHQMVEDGVADVEEKQTAQTARQEILTTVQQSATEAAKASMEASGEEDTIPSKSEVVGIATAAATAVLSSSQEVPESLKKLDPEQRAAALTDGKVLVAAGAGSGKSTTLVSRTRYLIEEKRAIPDKILVSSFNKKAAGELKTKIGKAVGKSIADRMTVGTLHGVFLQAINKYGTGRERAMFQAPYANMSQKEAEGGRGERNPLLGGGPQARAVNSIWRKCFAQRTYDGWEDADAPVANTMRMQVTRWAGNGVSVAEAKALAQSDDERKAALWYEMYEGVKGNIDGWKPECENPEAMKAFERFVDRYRRRRGNDGKEYIVRVGDFDDMIAVYKDLLERNKDVRTKVHESYDHILIDECQDLNAVQHRVMQLMTEHISDGSDGRSFWMIGDDKQAIYTFRGTRPELFVALSTDPSFRLRMMRTNYRCAPEIVDGANKLIANNRNQIPMEANPAPGRPRGEASIKVSGYQDEASTAISVANEIRSAWDNEATDLPDNAILCRTNKELNAYETALLMRGIPYASKTATSFLGSPETKGFLGYMTLATDSDAEKMQSAFADILNTPNRFFVKGSVDMADAVSHAINSYARANGENKKNVNPVVAMQSPAFRRDLLQLIKPGASSFALQKGMEVMQELAEALGNLQAMVGQAGVTTIEVFSQILEMPGRSLSTGANGRLVESTTTFRDELQATLKDAGGGDDDGKEEDEEDVDGLGTLGNIGFLYELAKPNADDPAEEALSPTTPLGFQAKIGRLSERAKELRVDLNQWEKAQEALEPEDRKPPPGVYLGTVHSVKGAEWPTVYVQMPKGRFPMPPRRKRDANGEEREPTAEELAAEQAEAETERRLAYVALTRPSHNLRVVYPKMYNGKPAGPSQYISEAGYVEGENVVTVAPMENLPSSEGLPKEAFVEDMTIPALAWKVS